MVEKRVEGEKDRPSVHSQERENVRGGVMRRNEASRGCKSSAKLMCDSEMKAVGYHTEAYNVVIKSQLVSKKLTLEPELGT